MDVLVGSARKRILQLGHNRLSTYGIGADRGREYWGSILRHLVHQGFLSQEVGDYSVLKLTPSSWPLLRGEQTLTMARPRIKAEAPRKTPRRKTGDIDANPELFEQLRVLRKKLADQAGAPPYIIFSDKALAEMAAKLPTDKTAFLAIHGVGFAKLEKYGDVFLNEIKEFLSSEENPDGE
jgi:ATP-dependent DNA helicase RecQ